MRKETAQVKPLPDYASIIKFAYHINNNLLKPHIVQALNDQHGSRDHSDDAGSLEREHLS